MTSSAREIAKAVHDYDPYVCVSLAARSGVNWAYTSDAQEWWQWTKEGILDFICPMTYAEVPERFTKSARELLPKVNGDVPYYGGIGVYKMESYEPLAEVIDSGRELAQDGFVTFNLRRLMPYLGEVKAKLDKPALLPSRPKRGHSRFCGTPTGPGLASRNCEGRCHEATSSTEAHAHAPRRPLSTIVSRFEAQASLLSV